MDSGPGPAPFVPPTAPLGRREAEQLSLFDNIPDLVARFDRDLRHLCVNRRVELATGRPSAEFVGRTNRELGMPPALVELWEEKLLAAFDGGRPVTLVFDYPGPEGIRHYEARLLPDTDPHGVTTVLAVTTDVTDRHRMEVALRASEERFRLLVEHARDVIFRFEYLPAPHYSYICPAIRDLTGYDPEEFYTDTAAGIRLIHPEDRPRLAELMAAGPTSELWFEVRFVSKGGTTIWTEQRVRPVYDSAGRIVAAEGIVRDITERKRIKEELRKAKEAAEEALAHVRQLRGLLPICSYCKKIRDGQDYWHQVESYISRHTEAQFSHDICPKCYESIIQPQLDEFSRDSK